jgi:hypothetical protein
MVYRLFLLNSASTLLVRWLCQSVGTEVIVVVADQEASSKACYNVVRVLLVCKLWEAKSNIP